MQTPIKQLLSVFNLSSPEMTEKLTMEHCLSASTGLSRFDYNMILNESSSEVHLAEMRKLVADHEPMAKFGYNNMTS